MRRSNAIGVTVFGESAVVEGGCRARGDAVRVVMVVGQSAVVGRDCVDVPHVGIGMAMSKRPLEAEVY